MLCSVRAWPEPIRLSTWMVTYPYRPIRADPDRLARCLGEVGGDLRLGGQFRASFFASGWEGSGRVHEREPPQHCLVLTTELGEPDEHARAQWGELLPTYQQLAATAR